MKKTVFFPYIMAMAFSAMAFEWPQPSENFASYFGELRGNGISTSIIFSEPSEIKAAEDGRLLLFLQEHTDDTDFFPSTLGTSFIIAHSDSVLTVYANMDKDTISLDMLSGTELDLKIKKAQVLGQSGNSAWHESRNALEFQVIDAKNNTAINPKVLMPRTAKEAPLSIENVEIQDRNGKIFDVARERSVPSGVYKVYRKRQASAVPYKSRVSINGTVVDEISYDILRQSGNFLCVSGKRNYPKSVLYPDTKTEFLGEALFSPGRNSLHLTLSDFSGKELSSTYTIASH